MAVNIVPSVGLESSLDGRIPRAGPAVRRRSIGPREVRRAGGGPARAWRAPETRAGRHWWHRRGPAPSGSLLRKTCYPLLLGSCGANVMFGQNVVLRHPHKIHIGSNVVIDDNCLLDAKGEGNRGITIGDGVFVGRNTILSCKNGDIELADGANIGFNCEIFSASRVTIGAQRADGGLRYVVGGDHDFSDPTMPVLEQSRRSAGVTIGAGAWLGAGAKILDGVTIGDRAIIGAGAVVNRDVAAQAIAVGVPARDGVQPGRAGDRRTGVGAARIIIMGYRSELESRFAKKATKAIVDYQMIEDGDRVMVGLSGGKDSWALLQILDVLRQRAPIRFSLVAVNVDSGYKEYKHDVIARTCEARGWEYRIEHTGIGEVIEDICSTTDADAVLAVRAAAARRAVSDREGGRRHQDRARPPRRRLHRDAAPEPLLRRRAEGDAGQARLRRWRACRDSSAGVRRRGRGARVHEGMRPADHRLLLSGLRRPRPAAAADQAAADGSRGRAPGREAVDAQGAGQRGAAAPARYAAEPTGRLARHGAIRTLSARIAPSVTILQLRPA